MQSAAAAAGPFNAKRTVFYFSRFILLFFLFICFFFGGTTRWRIGPIADEAATTHRRGDDVRAYRVKVMSGAAAAVCVRVEGRGR